MSRIGLVAKREFTAFSDGATFWVALLFGPMMSLGPALASGVLPDSASAAAASMLKMVEPATFLRFLLALVLWLALVTTLGMLLQAIVRERASRALETLLASVRPTELIIGKMIGVGGVTVAVTASWMLSLAIGAASLLKGRLGPLAAHLLVAGGDPWLMLQAVLLFVSGFAFYGALIAVIGATARDEAGAQNLARPLFGVLLIIFLAAVTLGCLRMNPPAWLVWIPPFAPFLLLLKPALAPAAAWGPVLVEIFGAAAGLIWAGGRLLSGQGFTLFHQSRPRDAQPSA
ncbi:MAG: ABC transporter permease [Caulobacteraceae bacterium]